MELIITIEILNSLEINCIRGKQVCIWSFNVQGQKFSVYIWINKSVIQMPELLIPINLQLDFVWFRNNARKVDNLCGLALKTAKINAGLANPNDKVKY